MARLRFHPVAVLAFFTLSGATVAGGQVPPPAGPAPVAAAAAPRLTEPALGNYLSWRLNEKSLPVTDRASDSTGTQFLIEFDELILSIRANHEFRAALKYRQSLAAKGKQMSQDPLQKMIVYGTWSVVGTELRFVPDPKRGGSGLQILTGTFHGREIDVPFDYRNGAVSRRAAVILIRDDHIF